MRNIATNVLLNAQGEYSNCPIIVSGEATVEKEVLIATANFDYDSNCGPMRTSTRIGEEVDASNPIAKTPGLKIIDPIRGPIVIAETAKSFADKANVCCVAPVEV